MGYQIKIIVKNTKPPVWRQILIPGGITFSQLGLIVNEVYGLEHSEQFQFEFYQRKIQLEEERKGKVFQPNFKYDLQEASNTYIDDYFGSQLWCSYYNGDEAFRIEIKEVVDFDCNLIAFKSKGIFKNSILDCEQLTKILNQKFQVITDENAHFEKMENIIQQEPIQLYRTNNPRSAENNIRISANSMLKQMSENISYAIESRRKQIEELEEEFQGENNEAAKEKLFGILEEIYSSELKELETSARKNYGMDNVVRSDDQNLYLRDSLLVYSKSELNALAKEMHIRGYGSLTLASLAEKIANELLSKNIMKKNFELLTDEEMEAFEYAIAQEGEFSPTDDVWDMLCKPAEKDYIAVYEDGYMEVPVDVKEAYQKINTEEFHKIRKKKVWLLDCITMVDKLYIVAPVDVLVQMYQKRKGYRLSKKEILQLLEEIPEDKKVCVLYDNKIMNRDFCKDNHYKNVEKNQGDKSFYIPTYEETIDYVRNNYPSKEPAYQKLLDFFEGDRNYDKYNAENLVIRIYHRVSFGWDLHDILDSLEEYNIVFDNEDELSKIVNILVEINNDTRKVMNRGHKPNELAFGEFYAMRRNGQMPTIVPGSSHAAQMLMQGKKEIEKMGFHLDFESNADEISVTSISGDRKNIRTTVKKVYPNDLCPCGSGKKYKKCCGRK